MTTAWVIRHDGEVKYAEFGSYYDVVAWMHRHMSCSVEHATQYEGWSIKSEEVDEGATPETMNTNRTRRVHI